MLESLEHTDRISIEQLRRSLRGEVIGPADSGYEQARRVYLSAVDRRPAAIIRVADARDVSRAVGFARDEGMELAIRSGGHSVAGHSSSEGGILLDLSALARLEIDVEGRSAWAETGLTAGAYTSAVGAYGLATGFGDAGSVGIGGITLCGGIGFLHRAYGMTIDSVIAADVVTAGGELVRADAESHPDLFWAVRGGGGNFGVVTRFQYRLHEVGTVLAGMLILPATADVLDDFLAEAMNAPEELSGVVGVTRAPPLPFLPHEAHGKDIIMGILVWSGGIPAGEKALAPFRALAKPIVDDIKPIRYPSLYEGGEPPHPAAMAIHTIFMDDFDRGVAEIVLDALERSTAPMSVAQFRVMGGAVARVPRDDTAFPHRQRRLIGTFATAFDSFDDRAVHDRWAGSLAGELRRGDPSAYVGFLTDDGGTRIREAYGASAWERLREVKGRYDPTNLFRRNHNIESPAG